MRTVAVAGNGMGVTVQTAAICGADDEAILLVLRVDAARRHLMTFEEAKREEPLCVSA
jgi:hypothetical protein